MSALSSLSKAKLHKTIFFFMENDSPPQKSVILTPGTCRFQTLLDRAFNSAWLGGGILQEHLCTHEHLSVCSYLLCM